MKKGLFIFILIFSFNCFASYNDTSCSMITVDGKDISGFTDTKRNYVIDSETIEHDIKCVTSNSTSTSSVNFISESNTYMISVNGIDGSVDSYNVKVNLIDTKDNTNTLDNIVIMNGEDEVDFHFDKFTNDYKITVFDVDSLEFKGILSSLTSSFAEGYGNRKVNLEEGDNLVIFKVNSESGIERKYSITVNLVKNKVFPVNGEPYLTGLIVNDNEIELVDGVLEYNITLKYDYMRSNVTGTCLNDDCTIGVSDIDYVVGENILDIKVSFPGNVNRDYKVIVNRLSEEESKVRLSDIGIKDYIFSFSKDITSYDLKINRDTTSLIFSINPKDERLNYSITGNKDLKNGSKIVISVTDDDGVHDYTINISKDEDKILGMKLETFCYLVFGFGIICLLGSLIVAFKKKN